MDMNKYLQVIRKYKKCPQCGSSWKDTKLQTELQDEVITITCECGLHKQVDENNKEV